VTRTVTPSAFTWVADRYSVEIPGPASLAGRSRCGNQDSAPGTFMPGILSHSRGSATFEPVCRPARACGACPMVRHALSLISHPR